MSEYLRERANLRKPAIYTRARFDDLVRLRHNARMKTRVRELRKAKGWNQTELAEAAGVRVATISKLERTPDKVEVLTVVKVAAALECTVDYLFEDTGDEGDFSKLRRLYSQISPVERDVVIRQLEGMAIDDSVD